MRRFMFPAAAMIVGIMSSTAWAHPQMSLHSHFTGFEAGAFHPFLGIDHLLAMVAVGILAAKAGGRALWLVPSTFLACLVLGGVISISGSELRASELVIATSVIALGAAIAIRRQLPLIVLMAACGAFGFYHGYAHGAEMPAIAQPAFYAAGFVLATAALHLAGIGIGRVTMRTAKRRTSLRFAGAAITTVGFLLLLAI